MSAVDLGTVTQASELAAAARIASQDGKRLLLEKDGTNGAGETRYRLSAESRFARYIRNVKAFLTGGPSGYDHDRRVQLVFKHLIDKEADRAGTSSLHQTRLDALSTSIRQLNGRSISGNAAALFVRLVDNADLSSVFPRSAGTDSGDLSGDSDHEYEEIPELIIPGYETADTWFPPESHLKAPDDNIYDTPIDGQVPRPVVDLGHDYDEIFLNDRGSAGHYDLLDHTGHSSDDNSNGRVNELRFSSRLSHYEDPVSLTTTEGIRALKALPPDPEAEKVPKLGRTQLRETRLSDVTVQVIKDVPAFQSATDAEFRLGLQFPERSSDNRAIGLGPLNNSPSNWEGLYLASLANTVNPDHLNKLSLIIRPQEFNDRLAQALAQEDSSEHGIAGEEFKGSKAADLMVAATVLDELLHEQEVSELTARENHRLETAAYQHRLGEIEAGSVRESFVDDDSAGSFTPLDPSTREPDEEVFTSLVARDFNNVDPHEENIYVRLSDIETG